MTTCTKRALLGGLAAAIGGAVEPAAACSLVARPKPRRFSEAAALRSLRELVALINAAPKLTDALLGERAEALNFDAAIADELLSYPDRSPIENSELLRAWGRADGKPDRSAIRLTETTFLKEAHGIALYQFTLTRDQYHPADTEGCNGLFVHDEYYGIERRSYLGVFVNNALRDVRSFPDWLRTI